MEKLKILNRREREQLDLLQSGQNLNAFTANGKIVRYSLRSSIAESFQGRNLYEKILAQK